jgi:hypothetical protein
MIRYLKEKGYQLSSNSAKSKGRYGFWSVAFALAAGICIYTSCTSVPGTSSAAGGRAARADYMLDGLVGTTTADVSHNFLPPVPYPYFKYTY